jgi:hypothetical protein
LEIGKDSSSHSQKQNAPQGLLYTLFAFFGFLAGWSFSKLHTPPRQSVNSPHSEDRTDQGANYPDHGAPRAITIPEVDSPPSPRECDYPKKKPKRWWKRWKTYFFALNVLTFIAVAYYAHITYRMWNEMQAQTRIQREGQRPWLGIAAQVSLTNPPEYRVSVPGQVELRLQGVYAVKNFGTSPAFYADNWVNVEFLMSTPDIKRPPVSRMICPDGSAKSHEGEVVFPGSQVTFGFNMQMARMIPGTYIREVNRVWLVGCISYLDASDTKIHHTRFWLRSAHPDNAEWIKLPGKDFRYMPITGFESWGEEAD